jgi:hypothetical protein
METEKFNQWALLELMGRQRIAGLVTEATIAGAGYLRVDVPETKSESKFTRFISPNSIYAINPVTEEVARVYAENLRVKPIDAWDIQAFMKKVETLQLERANQQESDIRNAGGDDPDEDDLDDDDNQ